VIDQEIAVITRMVQLGSVLKYDHLLRPELFNVTNREIYTGLRLYEQQYGVCMDEPTFRFQFPDFAWSPNDVQVEWFADELTQSYVAAKMRTLIADIDLEGNPKQAARTLEQALIDLYPYTGDAVGARVKLQENIRSRIRRLFEKKVTTTGISGITTGFACIDKYTNGTQREEIEIWAARPGNTKSLTLLYGAYMASLQGKRVSFISPEMSEMEQGIRLDAMMLHFPMMLLQSGRMSDDDRADYLERANEMLAQERVDIDFRDTIELRRKFTTGDMHRIIESDKPDIIMIDGLLLIEPVKQTKDIRSRVTTVMEELKTIASSTGVPIRLAHQINREPEKRMVNTRAKAGTTKSPLDGIPRLHELAEAGATEQFASRVICMRYFESRIYYAIRKNRNGPEGKFVRVDVDINVGRFDNEVEVFENDDNTHSADSEVADEFGF
jgi:replicative DNA helicase